MGRAHQGEWYEADGDDRRAAEQYRACLAAGRTINHASGTELGLAELIIRTNRCDSYDKAGVIGRPRGISGTRRAS